MTSPTSQAPLSDEALAASLRPLFDAVEAMGFAPDPSQPQPTWARVVSAPTADLAEPAEPAEPADSAGADAEWIEKVVVWRHPRLPWEVHGHVASSRSPFAVHLRFFDPDWRPAQVLPGHWEKGFVFDGEASLGALAARLAEVIWPRALAWFAAPCAADDLLKEGARVMSLVRPGPLLEQHRARAAWLASQGREVEAAFVRQIVAHIDALFR